MSEEPLLERDAFADHTQPVSEMSRANMAGLKTASAELHYAVPEFVGMTVFGSTARGDARAPGARGPDDRGSDADIYAYFRPEPQSHIQHNIYPDLPDEHKVVVDTDPKSPTQGMIEFDWRIRADYYQVIKEAIVRNGMLSTSDIHALPISPEIVTHQVAAILEQAKVYEESGSIPKGASFSRNLRGLFHVPVDDQELRPFRDQAITELAASPQGETAWKFIRYSIGRDEVGAQADATQINHRQVAQTLAEAVDQYKNLAS
jgi:predicted nucleotidyltransferase